IEDMRSVHNYALTGDGPCSHGCDHAVAVGLRLSRPAEWMSLSRRPDTQSVLPFADLAVPCDAGAETASRPVTCAGQRARRLLCV
ncbi:hypothetical protein, partial [Mycobacterium sp.]|uniref:hypothetical protein n=1 Tax=Mycobacterium sp. TaxID=1785 RepID=UPI0031E2D42B